MQCPGSGGNHEKNLDGFDFDPKRDRIDFNSILKKVADLPLSQQNAILDLVAEQLEPLGRALQFGTDEVLDTLIGTIKYMTATAPKKDLSDKAIINAKPGPKRYRLFDGGGLYLGIPHLGGGRRALPGLALQPLCLGLLRRLEFGDLRFFARIKLRDFCFASRLDSYRFGFLVPF